MSFQQKEKYDMNDLLELVRLLRSPEGCPWDREQTHKSIRKNLIEETYELAQAIDLNDKELLCEELGDLLLQVALHTVMEEESSTFTFNDICNSICEKLIYRHPHVFVGLKVENTEEVLSNWESLKNKEKGRDTAKDRLASVPDCLPALMYAQKVQKRADEFGYGYADVSMALDDLESEIKELKEAIALKENPGHEAGDILFSATNVARLLNFDSEECLLNSTKKFIGRVAFSEQIANENGSQLASITDEDRHNYWKMAKENE